MVVHKTCKWYQTARLNMTRRLVPSATFLGQILKSTYIGHYVCTMLFAMTSGDFNIDLTQNKFLTKVVGLLMNHPTPFVVCHYGSWFSRFDGRGGGGEGPLPDCEPIRARSE